MTNIKLRHIHRFRDRHGTVRYYLRVPGAKSIALPGTPGSPEFLAAYSSGQPARTSRPPAAQGSLSALVEGWYTSKHFLGLRGSTQINYRRWCDQLREAHGDKPVRLLNAAGVRRLLAERTTASGPQHLLRVLRGLMAHAVDIGMIDADPTVGVKQRRQKTDGFRPWTEADIAQYEAHHATGTKPRLALALMLYTGHRRADIVALGRQHVSAEHINGEQVACIVYTQQKTGRRVVTPIAPELAAELAHVPADRLSFLARANGDPYGPNGFYNVFIDWCREAGLPPGLSPHGLRKALGRRLAEAGATAREGMALLGHSTMGEADKYNRDADSGRLAVAGMGRIVNLKSQTRIRGLQTRRAKR